jgi:hypothetical protein
MMQTLNLGEGGLKTIPLWFELFSANRFGDRIFENAIVVPELQLLERGSACKELVGPFNTGFDAGLDG